jgi:hypothetical protein
MSSRKFKVVWEPYCIDKIILAGNVNIPLTLKIHIDVGCKSQRFLILVGFKNHVLSQAPDDVAITVVISVERDYF